MEFSHSKLNSLKIGGGYPDRVGTIDIVYRQPSPIVDSPNPTNPCLR
ncbi:MAG: hypothetical protein H6750_00700 [Nitrospiraceae bacterium]|nr:hypothetical protein [Nitrospira sp.]MCA9456854.1 hypothetical protein [Nitrospira sp.]MCB9772829.1 hypothetical protein [Nitrospiraceae bacterium]